LPSTFSIMTNTSWYIYIVECADGTLYTGSTNNLAKRLNEHNEGRGAKYTRGRGPVTLRFSEQMESKSSALKRESFIKRLSRVQKIALIFKKYKKK